jgi:hypothetical protein
MTRPVHVAFVLGAALLAASPAAAQTISTTPRNPPRWDVSGSLGWFAGNKASIADEWNNRYDAFAASLDAGRYWTPHLKSEAGATFTTEGSVYARDDLVFPGQPYPISRFREHHFRVAALSAAAVYQFLENSWVHPFISAGVSLAWERERTFTPEQIVPSSVPGRPFVVPAINDIRDTSLHALPFIGGGFKLYASERLFVRTDAGATFDARGVSQFTWRAGVGVDF